MSSANRTIVVCGSGLAGNMVTLALASALGDNHRIAQVSMPTDPMEDALYGSATSPDAYNFLRSLGLDEPLLILESQTAFSFGTKFERWHSARTWLQCHHSPFPTIDGTPLIQHLTRTRTPLQNVLVTAQAGLAGRFAHPPADPASPLAAAEYGYQFDTEEWSRLLAARVAQTRADQLESTLVDMEPEADGRTRLSFEDSETILADLIVDASGSKRSIAAALGAHFQPTRTVRIHARREPSPQLGPPSRLVQAHQNGWTARSHLQESDLVVDVTSPGKDGSSEDGLDVTLGQLSEAWTGNCIAIGLSAWALEPLTPAPMMLLQRDIERLLELIPANQQAETEKREYNRRFRDDVEHARLFHEAILTQGEAPDGTYWREATGGSPNEKLARKVRQFSHRGIMPRYDLEPFNEEDWVIALDGLGKSPDRYDRQADRLSIEEARGQLSGMRGAIEQLVSRMPPHHVYVSKLKQYLAKKSHA